jgi:hypothetical protein
MRNTQKKTTSMSNALFPTFGLGDGLALVDRRRLQSKQLRKTGKKRKKKKKKTDLLEALSLGNLVQQSCGGCLLAHLKNTLFLTRKKKKKFLKKKKTKTKSF